MKLQVLMFYQDDPKKCTAAKMVKFGLAQNIKKISSKGLVLDPFAEKTLLPKDASVVHSIVGIDCSWNLANHAFSQKFNGIKRKLPPLLAGNPVNYSKLNKLIIRRIKLSRLAFGENPIPNSDNLFAIKASMGVLIS